MKTINVWIMTLVVFLSTNFLFAQNIVVNEILTSNTSSITDEDDSNQDWVELYNNGASPANLLGYGLSDDPLLPFKWTFPNVTLGSGKYLIIWASDKNRAVAGSPLHTNFKISSTGENILLTTPSGTVLTNVSLVNLRQDISYGRLPNGSGPFVFFGTPTPNAVNSSTGYSGILNPPIFSQKDSGFFTTGFDLTLTSADSGTTILYTLDGSEPDENNLGGTTYSYKNKYINIPGETDGSLLTNSYRTLQYTSPISITDRTNQPNKVSVISSTFDNDPSYYFPDNPVFKGTIIRAKTIKPGFLSSETITKNYFITPQGNNKFTLPVVSLSINEDRFYEYNKGIYVAGKDYDLWRAANPNGTGSNSKRGNYYLETNDERVGHMNYFVNGIEVLSQDIGLKIRGGSTRRYEKKSLTVYARSEYGDNTLDHKFFPDLPYTAYDRLTLSNSGWDFRLTKYRDALIHQLCKEMHVEVEAYQPAIAFVNGEYWGLTNIRERFDNNYFDRVYKTKNVDILENNASIKEGDNKHYNAMTNYLKTNSLADTSKYEYIKTQLDPESFADSYITSIFFNHSDWPSNNVQYWRNRATSYNPAAPHGLDGRWRWMLHDLDATFSDFNENTLAIVTSPVDTDDHNPEWATIILRKLLENNTFKIYFINRFADLLNTSFLSSRIISKMDEMKSVIAPEMPGELTRWNTHSSLSKWQGYINEQKDFANTRPAFQRDHIRAKFEINKNINATLDVSDAAHGYIKINTINIIDGTPGISGNPYPWTGIYFHNVALKLKAFAKPGFVFSHWTDASNSTQEEISITPTANFSITAVFDPDNVNSLSYPSPNVFTKNIAILSLSPTVTGGTVLSYSITPNLPAGLSLNTATGVISGTPTVVSAMTTYTVTALNSGGSTSFGIVITVKDIIPSNLTYPSPNVFTKNTAISILSPTVTGGTPISYSITPSLPAGLSFNTTTGVISGTPTEISSTKTYTISASNSGGNATFDLIITIVEDNLSTHYPAFEKLKIFPNPFTDVLNITGVDGYFSYKIFTINGKLIKKETQINNPINLSELPSGIYILQLTFDEITTIRKITKNK